VDNLPIWLVLLICAAITLAVMFVLPLAVFFAAAWVSSVFG
jgi:hypothetical protein